jgi:hypothetical protein
MLEVALDAGNSGHQFGAISLPSAKLSAILSIWSGRAMTSEIANFIGVGIQHGTFTIGAILHEIHPSIGNPCAGFVIIRRSAFTGRMVTMPSLESGQVRHRQSMDFEYTHQIVLIVRIELYMV